MGQCKTLSVNIPRYFPKSRQYFELVIDVQEVYTGWNNHKCKDMIDLGRIYEQMPPVIKACSETEERWKNSHLAAVKRD